MSKDKVPFATTRPAQFRAHRAQRIQRIKCITATPIFKLIAIALFLFIGVRWVIEHNHDSDDWPGRGVKPTTSVESFWIDWSQKQYVQVVVDEDKLCNAVVVWHDIEDIGSRAQRTMLYPSTWSPDEVETDPVMNNSLTRKAHLLREARDKYYVNLQPLETLHENIAERGIWTESYIKLLAFNMTKFSRVLVIDSASLPLGNLDAVFLIPTAPLAMPWVYWGESVGYAFSNQMMLIEPSATDFLKIASEIQKADPDQYDLTILEKIYKDRTVRIPERPYHLMTGEFRRQDHSRYLGSASKKWDPDVALGKAKMLHFSDWPVPRPWASAPQVTLNKYMPKCLKSEWFGATNCRDRTLWLRLYTDYALKRKGLCGSHFEVHIQELEPDAMVTHGRYFHADEAS